MAVLFYVHYYYYRYLISLFFISHRLINSSSLSFPTEPFNYISIILLPAVTPIILNFIIMPRADPGKQFGRGQAILQLGVRGRGFWPDSQNLLHLVL